MDRPEYEQYSAGDVFEALRKVYEQHEKGEPLTWTGPDRLHFAVSATCLNPSTLFSQENLDYALEDQGQDFLDAFMQVCFQIGFHNGVLRGEEYGKPAERQIEFFRDMARGMRDQYATLEEKHERLERRHADTVARFIEASAHNVRLREQLYARSEVPLFHKTRLFIRQYKRAVNILHSYGERAWPRNVAFAWGTAAENVPPHLLERTDGEG